jgi:putative MATE family efflux protein
VLAGPIAAWLGLPPEVEPITTGYLQVTLGGSLFLVLMFVGGGILRGAGDSRTPMVAGLVANVLNAALTWVLIFGEFGLPALGAQGSAWAALSGRAVATGLLLAALAWGGRAVSLRGPGTWWPSAAVLGRILRLGVPAALEQVLISLAFIWFTGIMATQGTAVLAAQRIAFNALTLSFLPGTGFGLATTALVGMSVGAKRVVLGAAAAGVAARWTVAWMGGVGAVYFVFAPAIVSLFTTDPAVLADGTAMLRLIALAQPGWAIVFVFSGALRGLGDTRFPLIANAGSLWLTVLGGYVLLNYFDASAVVAWTGFAVLSPFMGALAWRRFSQSVAHWPRAVS